MHLINCEINIILTWSENCVIVYTDVTNQGATFATIKATLYVPVATLSAENNAKLLQQLKPGFKRTINWNKYLLKSELLAINPNLNHLVERSFQGGNTLSALAFEEDTQRTSDKRYYLPNVEIKDYNVMIFGKNTFDQPVKKMIK